MLGFQQREWPSCQWRQYLEAIDQDGDGFISDLAEDDACQMVRDADMNGDGFVSFEEYEEVLPG